MITLSEPQLAELACALELDQHRTGSWTTPSRLFVLDLDPSDVESIDVAIATGTVPWTRAGEGNPYHLLETAVVGPDHAGRRARSPTAGPSRPTTRSPGTAAPASIPGASGSVP